MNPKKITQDALDEARTILNLPHRATAKQIKDAYRAMAIKFHPDKSPDGDPQMIVKINEAYELLMQFCHNYLYEFDVRNLVREEGWEEWVERFYPDF